MYSVCYIKDLKIPSLKGIPGDTNYLKLLCFKTSQILLETSGYLTIINSHWPITQMLELH